MIKTAISLNTWKRFVKEGVLDSSRLNKRIIESWYRCRDTDVDPFLVKGKNILDHGRLHAQKQKSSILLDVALPQLAKMSQSTKELGMVALIIDPEGYVLSMSGSGQILEEAQKINFVEGVRWTEQETGTNAIGTALQAQEAIMVTGTEHFSIASHRWSCAAAPIYSDNGKLMGILDFSCPVDRTHPYMLGMVVSIAYAIERELSIRANRDEMELIQSSIDLIETNQPLLICNIREVVVGASKPIRQNMSGWFGMKVSQVTQYGFHVQMEVPIYSKSKGSLLGKCIYLIENRNCSSNWISLAISMPFEFKGEVGTSKSFQATLNEIKRVSPTDASVCLLGETGTGKEVIARTIHENSSRRNAPFIALNCGAIPESLIESELFGYVDGAFTGAQRNGYKGKFEQANHGTLFLDEIGEISHSMQVALLRVLQERKVTPIGSNKEIPVDVRIITATHRDLHLLVEEGKFREDLFYRFYVYPIHLPSLRERKEDIPHLVRYFCRNNNWQIEFPPQFFDKLMEYRWPGNIRELLNKLERLQILSQSECIDQFQILKWMDALEINRLKASSDVSQMEKEFQLQQTGLSAREKIQKELMIDALKKTNGNVMLAAKLINVPRSTFYKRLQKFNI